MQSVKHTGLGIEITNQALRASSPEPLRHDDGDIAALEAISINLKPGRARIWSGLDISHKRNQ